MQTRKRTSKSRTFASGWIAVLGLLIGCQSAPDLSGVWVVDKERSSNLEPWRSIDLRISVSDDEVSIGRFFSAGRETRHDSVSFPVDGTQIELPMEGSAKWLEQPHLGVFIDGKTPQQIRANWETPGHALSVQRLVTLETSQGSATVEILCQYSLSEDGSELTVVEERSSRPNPLTYVYTRK
ncbi:hypothetical protein ACFLRO_01165 [Bacteroidota bacterium]